MIGDDGVMGNHAFIQGCINRESDLQSSVNRMFGHICVNNIKEINTK